MLDAQVKRWSAMRCEQLLAELHDRQAYDVTFESGQYQVEVVLLEHTETYLHVLVAIDDGTFPALLRSCVMTARASHEGGFQPTVGRRYLYLVLPSDENTYAEGFADALTPRGFSCLFDRLATDADQNLPSSLKDKLRTVPCWSS